MLIIILLSLVLATSCSCDLPSDEHTFRVVSYNVQNLFDANIDGDEYPEYKDPKLWNLSSYRQRLRTLSSVVLDPSLSYPDVLVFQEVEGPKVIEDLLTFHLKRKGYRWYACSKDEGSAIAVAVVSRHPITNCVVHGGQQFRSVLEVEIETIRSSIIIFALHAKSQKGDFSETEAQRLLQIKALREPLQHQNDALLLLCGDFNENPDAIWHSGGVPTALVDYTHPHAPVLIEEGSLGITGNKHLLGPRLWYAPYLDQNLTFEHEGSCNWDGKWHRYDQILGNDKMYDRRGWEFDTFCICAPAHTLASDGRPDAWNLALKSGVSDHLPVMLTLKCR